MGRKKGRRAILAKRREQMRRLRLGNTTEHAPIDDMQLCSGGFTKMVDKKLMQEPKVILSRIDEPGYLDKQLVKHFNTVKETFEIGDMQTKRGDENTLITNSQSDNAVFHFDSGVWAMLSKQQSQSLKKQPCVLLERVQFNTDVAQLIGNERPRNKYQRDIQYKHNILIKRKEQYQLDKQHREQKIERGKKRYMDDNALREETIAAAKKRYRENTEYREDLIEHIKERYRGDPEYRRGLIEHSQERYRGDPEYRRGLIEHSQERYRDDPEYRRGLIEHSQERYRDDEEYRKKLIETNTEKYHTDQEYRTTRNLPKSRRKGLQYEHLLDMFLDLTSEGPEYVCCCCSKLLFKDQVRECDLSHYEGTSLSSQMAGWCIMEEYLHECNDNCDEDCGLADSSRSKLWLCFTCHRKISKGILPSEATVNGLHLTPIPDSLRETNILERQLLSLRLPFIKMVALPRGGQYGVYGPVVSVPSNVEETVSRLPRADNSETLIRVKLKKNLNYRGYVNYLCVSTSRLADALEYLKSNNEYYRNVSVDLDGFENPVPGETEQKDSDHSDSESENDHDEDDRLQGIQLGTCLQPVDVGQEFLDQHFEQVFCVAPAERHTPVSILQDEGNEIMSFPVQFPHGEGHYKQDRQQNLTLHRYFVNRLLNVDPRFSSDLSYLFYAQYLNDLQTIISSVSIAVRKGHATNQSGDVMTVGDLVNREHLRDLIRKDQGYKFLKPVRGTPPFWQSVVKDLFAMISQIGKPTWFVSLSAADMRWTETMQSILRQTGRPEKVADLSWAEKCNLLKSNPVTVARMFDHRLKLFFNSVILSDKHPIGPIADYFYRIEFQQRGSPHAHCLFWVEGAPEINKQSDEEIVNFIDKYVSCVKPPEEDAVLFEQVQNVQMHSRTHSNTCKKRGTTCRFHFPRTPSSRTFVCRPDDTLDSLSFLNQEESIVTAKRTLEQVKDFITASNESSDQFDCILQAAGVTSEDFEEATRVLSSKTSVVYKRDVESMWVNNYSPELLRCWNANLDIQYITDVYACVMYIISYITKTEREMGLILEHADREAKDGNLSAQQSMKKIGGVYLRHREVSAQEAVYRVCELNLKKCSRNVVFIPVGSNPTHMSMPLSTLRGREYDSEDLWLPSIIDKYKLRPNIPLFNDMCLALFCSEYRVLSSSEKPNLNSVYVYSLLDDSGYIRKRTNTKPAVVKYPRFSKETNAEEYYLTSLQLFLPYRINDDLKPQQFNTYEEFYQCGIYQELPPDTQTLVQHVVEVNRSKFETSGYSAADIEEVYSTVDLPESAWAAMFSEQEAERLQSEAERTRPQDERESNEDIPDLFGVRNRQQELRPVVVRQDMLSRPVCRRLMRSMNDGQQRVFYTVRNLFINMANGFNVPPFCLFLTGSAGTGKSHLIHCISNECRRIFEPRLANLDQQTVLLTSATGSAAFNIGGTTLHHAFSLPLEMPAKYQHLKEEKVATLRAKYASLKLLIIDEVSLVDDNMLQWIHGRLRQIMQTKDDSPFGNVSVIAVGDFHQLPPVGGKALCTPRFRCFDLWNDNFRIFELTEIMRQRDSCEFAAMLNRLRTRLKGEPILASDLALLHQCRENSLPDDSLHIFPSNGEVNDHNKKLLQKTCEHVDTIPAEDFLKDPATGRMTRCIRPIKTNKGKGLLAYLDIGINAKVMLTRNINIDDGLVNGAIGIVVQIHKNNNHVDSIIVKFENDKVGQQTLENQVDKTGVVLTRYQERTDVEASVRHQFPLALSWALTYHKVQGITTDKAVVSLKEVKRAGMAYVGLSRVKTAEGLKILDFNLEQIFSSRIIATNVQGMKTFETIALEGEANCENKICFCLHNTEDLPCHIEDIRSNRVMLSRNVLCFTETHLSDNNGPLIENFHGYFQCRADSYDTSTDFTTKYKTKSKGGVAIYTRDNTFQRVPTRMFNIENIVVMNEQHTLLIATIYKPPSYPVSLFVENLQNFLHWFRTVAPTNGYGVIAGDFNEDASFTEYENVSDDEDLSDDDNLPARPIQELFYTFGFIQLVRGTGTAQSGKVLDHVYVLLPEYRLLDAARVQEIYYSFHELVYFDLPLNLEEN